MPAPRGGQELVCPEADPYAPIGSGAVSWAASGGNPGGYIVGSEIPFSWWFFAAPATFLGDRTGAFGHSLSWDLVVVQSGTTPDDTEPDVVLIGGGLTLLANGGGIPSTAWTSYSVNLDATSSWTKGSLSGPTASDIEITTALGNLTALYIRGEFYLGPDQEGLDNVALGGPNAVPEPGTLSLTVLPGLAAGVCFWWKRRQHTLTRCA